MTCYNKVGATKMSCYTEILKLSRCLDSEQAQGKSHKSTIPFHINRLYKEKNNVKLIAVNQLPQDCSSCI